MVKFDNIARQLVDDFSPFCAGEAGTKLNITMSKECALKCVDKLEQQNLNYVKHWQQVRKEIQKL